MDTRTVEYFGGPADGRRETALAGADGLPGAFRVVAIPARFESMLDNRPTVPAEVHRYLRTGAAPVRKPGRPGDADLDGNAVEVWQYTWGGSLH